MKGLSFHMIKIVSSFTIKENLKVALDDKIQSSSLVFYRRNMTQRTPFICKKNSWGKSCWIAKVFYTLSFFSHVLQHFSIQFHIVKSYVWQSKPLKSLKKSPLNFSAKIGYKCTSRLILTLVFIWEENSAS